MYSKSELLSIIKQQLALEYNCSTDDFNANKNIITTYKALQGRRHFIDGDFFFKMITFGQNAVISSNENTHAWLHEYVNDKVGHHLFEHTNLIDIDDYLKQYDKKLWQTHHMFLPNMQKQNTVKQYSVKWFEQDEIAPLYGKSFHNALCEQFTPKRPDVLAVAAFDNETIIGMAGCSADTPELWQIGIDVMEGHRGKGIGTYLVTLLKNEIIHRGKIPYYGTSLSNLHSWNIAINSGFFPAWVEVETIEK